MAVEGRLAEPVAPLHAGAEHIGLDTGRVEKQVLVDVHAA